MLKGQQVTSKYSLSFLVQERTCQQMGRQVNRQAGYTARLQGRHKVCNVCETVLSNHKINNTTTNSNICWIGISLLREVVSNFQESGDRSKNLTFFFICSKRPFGELFSKIVFKSSSEFLFWQKIRKFEIGQNVPNLRNFYRAFSAFSQRSYKTTQNYLGLIFL